MQTDFRLTILTPKSKFYDNPVKSIVLPGEGGLLGIRPHHAPIIAALKEGALSITDMEGKKIEMKIMGGFLEVNNNIATVLTEAVELNNK